MPAVENFAMPLVRSEVRIAGVEVTLLTEITDMMACINQEEPKSIQGIQIDQIPLSLQPGIGEECLFTLSRKACFVAAKQFYEKTKDTEPVRQLGQNLGQAKAQVLIEKVAYLEFLVPMKAWVRRIYAQAIGRDDWNTPVMMRSQVSFVFVDVIWPSPQIPLNSSGKILSELSSRIKDATAVGLSWGTLWAQLALSRVFGRKFTSGAVGLEITEGIDNHQKRSELPWGVNRDGNMRYVMFFNPSENLTKQDIARLNTLDATSVLLASSPRQLTSNIGRFVWHRLLEPPTHIRGIRCRDLDSVLSFAVKRWGFASRWWEKIFQHYRILAWVPIRESTLTPVIQSAVANRVGAVQLARQRSEFNNPGGILGYHAGNINLVWGDSGRKIIKTQRNGADEEIIVGHFFGASPEISYPYTASLKRHMLEMNVSFSLAYFDIPANNEFKMSREQGCLLYQRLLMWCLKHPDVGLILKPKCRFSESPSVEEICSQTLMDPELLRDALDTNRVIVVPHRRLLPLAVSKAADLTLGAPLSSAALEANISGLRAIHYTPNLLDEHILEKEARDVVMFDDLDKLMAAIQSARDGNTEIGDATRWISEIDQYRDGLGPERYRYILENIVNNGIADPAKLKKMVDMEFGTASQKLN